MNKSTVAVFATFVVLVGCKGCKKDGGDSDNPLRDQVVVEVCDNGEDDNEDGWTDCQDPVCQSVDACVFEPPNPADLAPPDDPTSKTDFADSIRFLWEGDNPVIRGLDPDALDMDRVSVVRGEVLDRDGNPVSGVRANIAGRREYGYTFSRDDGQIDLVVNGGENVNVRFGGADVLEVDREVSPQALAYDWTSEVVLTRISEKENPVDFGGDGEMAVGEPTADEDGERTARLYVPPDTTATVRLPDGQEATLEGDATVRLTEYTVGETGMDAMPAGLPEESAYTYALELSVDEARDVNAEAVRFNKPIYLYLDNFLDFPIGSPVPSGFYLRSSTVWEPNPNGLVFERTSDGISLSESGTPVNVAVRQALGISSEEIDRIKEMFDPGETFWRVPVRHFSPCDLNWPYEFPEGAVAPDDIPEEFNKPDPCAEAGSRIECQNQTLTKQLNLPGTPLTLSYRSDRVAGAGRYFEVPLTSDEVNNVLERIVVEVKLAGRYWREEFDPEPNLTYEFRWDGIDGYGREVNGEWPISVNVGYYYEVSYTEPPPERAFAENGGDTLTDGRRILPIWNRYQGTFGSLDSLGTLGMGGWALDLQHVWDGVRQVFHPGAAPDRQSADVSRVATVWETFPDSSALPYEMRESVPLTMKLARGPDDSIYILHHPVNNSPIVIRRNRDGSIDHIGGRLGPNMGCQDNCGLGGPATEAQLFGTRFGVAGDGTVYIGGGRCLYHITPDGTYDALIGDFCAPPATETDESFPNIDSLAVRDDGNVYVANSSEVFYIDTANRTFWKVGGCSNCEQEMEFGAAPAGEVDISPSFMAATSDGGVVFGERSGGAVGKITVDGRVRLLAPALEDRQIRGLTTAPDGTVYAAVLDELAMQIGRLTGTGFQIIAGTDLRQTAPEDLYLSVLFDEGEAVPATSAAVFLNGNLMARDDGRVYYASLFSNPDEESDAEVVASIIEIASAYPRIGGTDVLLPAPTGQRLYRFDEDGRIKAVLDPLDLSEDLTFEYGEAGYATAVTDRYGNRTEINRDGQQLRSIVGPWGHETSITTDSDGYLAELTLPDGSSVAATYSDEGLLTGWQDGEGNAASYEYTNGRLTRAEDAAGGWKSLTRYNDNSVLLETSGGRSVRYGAPAAPTGRFEYTTTDARGLEWTIQERPGYLRTVTRPDGTEIGSYWRGDPRFGVQARYLGRATTKTPSGLEQEVETTRRAELGEDNDFSSLRTLTETKTIGEDSWVWEYDASNQTATMTTPVGRTRVETYDEHHRVVSTQTGDLTPVTYEYDDEGLLAAIRQGPEAVEFTNERGYRSGNESGYSMERDENGRVVSRRHPSGATSEYAWDANDAATSVTPPGGGGSFEQTITPALRLGSRTWPDGSTATFDWTSDRRLAGYEHPSGRSVSITRDDAQRPVEVVTDEGTYRHQYDPDTGKLVGSSTPFVDQTFAWDGFLLTERTLSVEGTNSTLTRSFDDDFQLIRRDAGGTSVDFDYDRDGTVVGAGPVEITRRTDVDLPTRIVVGNIETTLTYNEFGVVSGRSHSGAGFSFDESYEFEGLNFTAVESEGTRLTFSYDADSRLSAVAEDGAPTHTYDYNAWGYRTSIDGTTLEVDVNGRATSFGARTYDWDDDGNLASVTDAGETTSFRYDSRGYLIGVTTPTETIDYRVDSLGRRVASLRDGVLERVWVYDDSFRPIAELDGSGSVRSRFVYATNSVVPDAMIRNGTTYRIVHDWRYSVRRVVNASTGVVEQAIDYDPLGRIISDSNPGFQPLGFAGGLHDSDLGLVSLGARSYDTTLGRWTTPDHRSLSGSGTLLYSYGAGNPVCTIDPDGTVWIWVAAGALAAGTAFLWHQNKIKNEAAEEGLRRYQGQGLTAGPTNQVRHCTWICKETRTYGSDFAMFAADWHENPDIPSEIWGGGEENSPDNPDSLADWRANYCGEEQGREGNPDETCGELCFEALQRGEMEPAPKRYWKDHKNMSQFIFKKMNAGGKVGAGTFKFTFVPN